MPNRDSLPRGTMRSGEHALWDAHLMHGATMRDMTVTVEAMVKIGRDFERSMLKFGEALRALDSLRKLP